MFSLSPSASKNLEERNYAFELPLYAAIKAERTKKALSSRSLALVLYKEKLGIEYWPRLSKDKRPIFVKTDFSKWVDEDEQDGEVEKEEDDLGMGGMGGMPGMGGMGGMPGLEGMGGMGGMGGGMPGMGGMDIQQVRHSFYLYLYGWMLIFMRVTDARPDGWRGWCRWCRSLRFCRCRRGRRR